MTEELLKPSELKKLLELEHNGNYEFRHFVNKNYFHHNALFRDNATMEEVTAKLVLNPSEGELYHWPRFCQENLNPLLEMVTIGETWHIFISPYVGETLKDHVTDYNFFQHPKCFERKTFYATGILRGVEYLHKNHFCLMTLCAENIYICKQTDRAIIAHFSGTTLVEEMSNLKISPPVVAATPELEKTHNMDLLKRCALDIWYCGIMCLQIFTQFYLPNNNSNVLEDFTIDLVTSINCYSHMSNGTFANLKSFLEMMLNKNMFQRASASEALSSNFLNQPPDRLDKPAREYWEAIEKTLPRKEYSKNSKKTWSSKLTLENINQPKIDCKRNKSLKMNSKLSNFRTRKCFSFRYQIGYKSPLTKTPKGTESCPNFNFPEPNPKNVKKIIKMSLSKDNSNCLSDKEILLNTLSNSKIKFKNGLSNEKKISVDKKPFFNGENNNFIETLNKILTSKFKKREKFFDNSKIDDSSIKSINFCEYLQRLDFDSMDNKDTSPDFDETLNKIQTSEFGKTKELFDISEIELGLKSINCREDLQRLDLDSVNNKDTSTDFEDKKNLSKLKIRSNGGYLHNVWRTEQEKKPAKGRGADLVETVDPLTLIISGCPRNKENKSRERSNASTPVLSESVVSQIESIDFSLKKSLFTKNAKKKRRKNVLAKLFCFSGKNEQRFK